jgi:uncharacterized membrane protein YhaH (DUF805 family)
VTFTEAIRSALSRYAEFSGRARRAEFWYFQLFASVINVVIVLIGAAFDCNEFAVIVAGLIALALILPGLGVTVRRLHDVDRSGWWIFIPLLPVVGSILLLVWECSRGTPGTNRFGPDPIA